MVVESSVHVPWHITNTRAGAIALYHDHRTRLYFYLFGEHYRHNRAKAERWCTLLWETSEDTYLSYPPGASRANRNEHTKSHEAATRCDVQRISVSWEKRAGRRHKETRGPGMRGVDRLPPVVPILNDSRKRGLKQCRAFIGEIIKVLRKNTGSLRTSMALTR